MFIFQMTSGGTMARMKTSTPTSRVKAWETRATSRSGGRAPRTSRRCIQRSLTTELDAAIRSELTVEIEAATGPTMATPVSQGGKERTMAVGMMSSTEPP